MLWLALHCPTLALDGLVRRWPAGAVPALAVTDADGARRVVVAATEAAAARGVFAGQSVATALALSPELVVVARRIADERRALTEAALAVLRFTPIVSLRASGLVMEVSASLRLFGGWRALKRRIAGAMRLQGLGMAAGEGPTPHGAWLLAKEHARRRIVAARDGRRRPPPSAGPRARPDFAAALDAVPIVHLESLGPSARRMDGIGCHTLADLRRLPAKGLARRFGEGLIDELARATGERPDPQNVFVAPDRFEARIELMARVESAEALIFASQRLLGQLSGWLTARRAAVRGFTLILHHDRWTRDAIAPTPVPIALATPGSDLARLSTLVRERLSRLPLTAPVVDLSLEAPVIVEETESPGSLFPEREEATDTLARLLEKLTARLGAEAMSRIERVADHRPERAWREVPALRPETPVEAGVARTKVRASGGWRQRATASGVASPRSSAGSLRASPSGLASAAHAATGVPDPVPDVGVAHRPRMSGCACGPRPVWLFAEPRQLAVRRDRPILESSPLYLMTDPERIEAGWWDDAPVTRDYFIAENAAGLLVWIYRERLPKPERSQWYLQGVFG